MAVSGLVVAGGASRRFGSDKRVATLDGRALLRRAVDAVAAVCDEVMVAVSVDNPLPTELVLPPDVRIVTDAPGDAGPLAGVAAGLAAAAHDVVVVLAGDHAWADPAVLARLRDRALEDSSVDAAVLEVDGRRQPLVAAYRRGALTTFRARLDRGDRRAVAALDDLRVATVHGPGVARTARDVDVPSDLDHARRTVRTTVDVVDPDGTHQRDVDDVLVAEEPLRILMAGPGQDPIEVATTMRTPGHELELAVGLLHAEGLLVPGGVAGWRVGDALTDARPDDTIVIELRQAVDRDAVAYRHTVATASCGVCGRATIDDLLARIRPLHARGPTVSWSTLAALPAGLRERQRTFEVTGGLHATGIATRDGQLRTVREDVGRHNALDAAIGAHLLAGDLPLDDHLVVLSGRVGVELVHKVALAGGTVVVAVGAPSDLAVRTADAAGITLCGFLRGGSGNVYTHRHRVRFS